MLARATACSVHGLAGVPVLIEADIANGLPNFTIVGLTDRAIQEARERVKASVRNSGFEWPQRRLTVNLAPAEVPKEGTGFDLGIAMAILCLTNRILRLEGLAFIGELALDGSVRPVTGVLPMARCLRVAGIRRLVVAEENAAEAALVDSLEVVGVSSLARCVAHLDGSDPLPLAAPGPRAEVEETTDLSEVRGQEQAKRALEIAAAGGHNLLMVGPPGSGKTMLARAFCSLLPDLDGDESIEVAALYSLRGALRERPPTATRPPFRAPHHSVSRAGLIGGGSGLARPGEISLAHRGVLFLDEICEFSRSHLEALRQPLEERTVSVVRSRGAVHFPADFTLVAAANPCPCGHLGDETGCSCTPRALGEYSSRLSGPIRDRIDLFIDVPRQRFRELFDGGGGELSASVRERVRSARARQAARNPGVLRSTRNAALDGAVLQDTAGATPGATRLLALAGERMQLSARGFFRVLRVARTIADLRGSAEVGRATSEKRSASGGGASGVSVPGTATRLDRGAPGWPDRLEHLQDPPATLWLRGVLPPADAPCVAVVGSRRATPGGLLTARDIAVDLAAAGVTVVSGMARGIDGAAHRGALHGNGHTVAVLGCGIDLCYPSEHRQLRDQIALSGCVVSEDGGSEPPIGWRFPQRNRIIAALAEAVVVVEATARSGALSTARWAADLGREVLAVPGSIRSPSSVGTNLLIRDGVRPYLGVADLFDAVPRLRRALVAPVTEDPVDGQHERPSIEADPLLARVLDQLSADPVHPDDLAATLGIGAAALGTMLTTLQLRGAITDVCGGRVARTF